MKEARISSVLSEPQRALLGYISSGQEAISRAETELMTKVTILLFALNKPTLNDHFRQIRLRYQRPNQSNGVKPDWIRLNKPLPLI